ncbi:MAG: hypothetical protein ACFE7R_03755 [Candidatus Hodarchaeota archaeon]
MESTVESRETKAEHEKVLGLVVEPAFEEKTVVIEFKPIEAPVRVVSAYAKPISGIVAMIALFYIPLITVPGLLVITIFAEVYLLDWTYNKLAQLKNDGEESSKDEEDAKMIDPETEVDRIAERPASKDQFVR